MAKLNADEMNVQTSKTGDPFTFKTFKRGDEVTGLSDERVSELLEQGVLVDSDEEAKEDGPATPGQSEAPGEKAAKQTAVGSGAEPAAAKKSQGVQTPKA